ncbi:MAG: NDP-sugar synthase [Methanobacteriota archaeon]|nr:MAG: NDP-sugar synthase [Euryarchaeota archaeon]
MQLVIIAGGLGTRLRPLTLHRPKALVPLVDRPQIAHILDALPPSCDEVIVAVNYMFEQVRDFFRERQFGVAVRVVEEPVPLGTAGAIKSLQRWLNGPFAVYNGDVVDTIEFDRLVAAHEKAQGIATIAVWPVDDPSAYGVVAVEKGRITRFVEKPAKGEAPSNLVNAGRYVFEPRVLDLIEAGHAVSLEREVFPRLIEHGVFPYRYEGFWSDAGTLPNYLNAQRLLLDAGHAKISPDADVTAGSLRPPVYVAAGAYVEGRVGPHVVLGKACRIGRASLRNATLLEGVSVDDKAEVTASIIGAGAAIGEGAHVRDSILGDTVQVSPHATIVDERVTA